MTTKMTHPAMPIPSRLADLDAGWLTDTLRACGVLAAGAHVEAIDVARLGEGEGFLGELGRVRLTYDSNSGEAPASVIAKFPSPVAGNRALGLVFASYEKEIRFYRELAPHVPVKIPTCYFGAYEPPKRSEAIAQRVLDRLPGAVTVRLLDGLMARAGQSERRFGLLIEDLGDARVGNQVRGCSPADAELALRALAQMHAAFWESPLLDRAWLPSADHSAAVQHAIYRRVRPSFETRFQDDLTPAVREILAWNDRHGPALIRRMARSPRTLLHGDYRADNLMYHDGARLDGAGAPITIIDFQAVMTGNPMMDVAYFLRPNMSPEDGEAHEERLVEAYHESLAAAGVADYPIGQCRQDYALAMLWAMHRAVLLIGALDLSHERGMEIAERAVSRALVAARTIDLASVRI